MNCEACTDRLVELLYEELPDAETEATRTHLDGCEACAEAYERITMGHDFAALLPMDDPPAAALSSVLEMAAQKAAERRPEIDELEDEEEGTPPRDDDETSAWGALLHWVGGFAMRPQFAMAMMLFLMVGLGMWYLPSLQDGNDPTGGHAYLRADGDDEVGPSQLPREPLDLVPHPRRGRILPREEGDDERPRATATPPPRERTTPPPAQADAPEEVLDAPTEDAIAAHALELSPGETAMAGAEPGQPGRAAERAAPQSAMAMVDRGGPAPSLAPAPAVTPEASEAEGAGTAQERLDRGLARFRQRDYRGAEEELEAVIRRPDMSVARALPSVLHHLARSRRHQSNCRGAVGTYERLLRDHPTYSGRGEAMVEAAACYRQLGRLSQARRWAEAGRSVRGASAAAGRELALIAMAERAQDRAAEAVEAAPAEATTSAP